MRLCTAAASGSLGAVQAIKEGGANLDAMDYDGRTALHVASSYGHKDVVQWLLDNEADPCKCDNFGLTPLNEAQRHAHESVARLLASKGGGLSRLGELKISSPGSAN